MKVAVIGGGPSGLVALKHIVTAHQLFATDPIEAKLFELEESIGGKFKHHDYEEAELVSSRYLTTFSDYRCPPGSPDFLATTEYVAYLEGYCHHFDLWPHINLKTTVIKIARGNGGVGHVVRYTKDGVECEWHVDAIALCSGLHHTPNILDIDGIGNVPVAMHSSLLKGRQQFGEGKDILIVGSGETEMDMAHLAVTANTKSVTLCHRDGFLCAAKRAPETSWFGMKPKIALKGNISIDVGAASLFDTAYVHPWLKKSDLPWWYYDRFVKWTTWLVSGTKNGFDQWVGEISPQRCHAKKIFFMKSAKVMPYITEQYRKTSALNTLRSYVAQAPLADNDGRKIDLAPWPERIDKNGVVHFIENGRPEAEVMREKVVKPDIVILATGYKQSFPFFDDKDYPVPRDANIRAIWKEGNETVAFIGFVRPSFGGFAPLSEMQSQLWVCQLMGALPQPLKEESHYRLEDPTDSRVTYGVDHESYVYQLALDTGSAPSISEILPMGWKMTMCWALSAQVNTKFRLVGPWKWAGAKEVMQTEIWETVTRRRSFFGHVTLSIVPILLFGSLSALLWIVDEMLKLCKGACGILARNWRKAVASCFLSLCLLTFLGSFQALGKFWLTV